MIFRKKEHNPYDRRPESEKDRERIRRAIAGAYARGEINREKHNELDKRAGKQLTRAEMNQVHRNISLGLGVVTSFATVVGIAVSMSHDSATTVNPSQEDPVNGNPRQDPEVPDDNDNPDDDDLENDDLEDDDDEPDIDDC